MSLYVTELRRLFKRRLTRVLLVLMVLGLAGIAVSFSMSTEQVGQAERVAAEAKADREYQEAVRDHQRTVAECEAAKARGEQVGEQYGPDCGREQGPQPEYFRAEWFLPYEFNFRGEFGVFIMVFAVVVMLFAFVVGASFVGAEWHTGSMMNLLVWRPKRNNVLLTKLAAVLSALLALSVVLGLLWTGAFWLIAKTAGSTAKMTSGVWQSFAIDGLRGIGIVLAVGAIGFGLASVGRHTAMALGAALAVFLVSEVGIRVAVDLMHVQFGQRYVLSTYAFAWFTKSVKLLDERSCDFSRGECVPKELLITWQDSALVFGIGTALALGAAFWMMRRRDVA